MKRSRLFDGIPAAMLEQMRATARKMDKDRQYSRALKQRNKRGD